MRRTAAALSLSLCLLALSSAAYATPLSVDASEIVSSEEPIDPEQFVFNVVGLANASSPTITTHTHAHTRTHTHTKKHKQQ